MVNREYIQGAAPFFSNKLVPGSRGISRWGIWTPYLASLAREMGFWTARTSSKSPGGRKLRVDVEVLYWSVHKFVYRHVSKVLPYNLRTNYELITKCTQHFMIHKRRRLPRCPITQSSESVQQSVHRFLSYASLQKVLNLILPPNHRHFLSNHRVSRLFYDKRQIPNVSRRLRLLLWEWSGFIFPKV